MDNLYRLVPVAYVSHFELLDANHRTLAPPLLSIGARDVKPLLLCTLQQGVDVCYFQLAL